MKKQDMLPDALPEEVRACIEQLKHSDPQLSPAIEKRLYHARQVALNRFAERAQQHQRMGDVLSIVSFGHPRIMSILAFSVGMLIASMVWMGLQNNEDAVMLGDDMPIEAFVDNGFDAWGTGE